ncbi:hypothetical protein ACS0TY_011710 [Phlomoides rotata]
MDLKKTKVKKGEGFEYESRPLLESGEGKRGTKLKILMSKEAASRLLSKCRNGGGVLELKDVAQHLKNMPPPYLPLLSHNAKYE